MQRALKLFALAAGVILAIFLGTATVRAEAHDDHCICGGNGACIETATAANGHTEDIPAEWKPAGDYTTLNSLIKTDTAVGGEVYIYLTASFTMTDQISLSGRTVHLCLNGQTLTTAASKRCFQIAVASSTKSHLTICDCSAGKTGCIIANAGSPTSSGPYQGGLVYVTEGGTFKLFGGSLLNGVTYSKNPGGNLSVRGDDTYGGAVFTMYGGVISGGTSTDSYGGNIDLQKKGSMTIYGGEISNGTAGSYGGNIYVNSTSSVTMAGGKLLAGAATGGSSGTVYLGGTMTVTGGEITGGTATANAGGINVDGGKLYLRGGSFTGGTAGSGKLGNMIYASAAATLEISGNTVITGTDNARYNIYSASKNFTISGSPKLGVNVEADTLRLVNSNGATAKLTVNGGSFDGNLVSSKGAVTINDGVFAKNVYAETSSDGANIGTITVNGGYFVGTVSHTTNNPGKVTINKGYFKLATAVGDENVIYGDDVWMIADDPRIPFEYVVPYTKANGTAGSFTTKYAVTTCQQITGRNMYLTENLALGLISNVDLAEPLYKNGDEVGKLSVEINGVTKEAAFTEMTAAGTDLYSFVYDGVTPELMGDEITVTLYASDGTTALDTKTYTIKEYLESLKASTAADLGISADKKAALDTLVNDLLFYGGEAQKKFDHKTDALVSDGIAGSGRNPDGNIADIWNKTTVTAANYQDADAVPGFFKEATVIHENVNWIRVKFIDNAADGNTTFTIQKGDGTEEAITLDGDYLCTAGLMPTEYGKKLIFRAYRGGEVISKVEYSMNSYCVRKTVNAFSDALYNYGVSALAYSNAN